MIKAESINTSYCNAHMPTSQRQSFSITRTWLLSQTLITTEYKQHLCPHDVML